MTPTTLEIWSAVSNWVAAIANVTLFIIGFWTLRHDRRRIARMELVEQRKYAEHVYAWIEEWSDEAVTIFCRNGSASVIYDVQVMVLGTSGNIVGDTYEIDLMKPLEERSFKVRHAGTIGIDGVSVAFRDPGGFVWRRHRDGRLVQDAMWNETDNRQELIKAKEQSQSKFPIESKRRSLVKTLVWRIVGIIWTWLGAFLILSFVPSKYSGAAMVASLIVVYHHSTRMFMYYFYERIWLHIRWGRTLQSIPRMTWIEKLIWTLAVLLVVLLILFVLMYISPALEGAKR